MKIRPQERLSTEAFRELTRRRLDARLAAERRKVEASYTALRARLEAGVDEDVLFAERHEMRGRL